ncbi:hypothetical protein [Flavobacterium cerinum]|uniref:DUF2624 family protein n=1 Tax=Flavobacterium cerinum TaxID=2502784 RepID=A0ABY5IVI7_9FLAO|nr:hypothetical protein [Flavobacterium cerinum]UUC45768.1 hypothetical protein NOX80_00815 [Flavobacterium cerinum]
MKEEMRKEITPQRAIELLRQDGIEVDEQNAALILEFLFEIAEIAVDQYFESAKKSVNLP